MKEIEGKVISFFGASVTAQKNSYAKILSKKLKCQQNIFGYGGEHLLNAGMIYIDNVLKIKPEICFIDWFSTGYKTFDENTIKKYMNTIVYKFSKQNCKLIFLFLPYNNYDDNMLLWHNLIKQYLDKSYLFYIDLNKNLKYSKEIIRDFVHTTDLGSEIYSNLIYENLILNYDKLKIPNNFEKTKTELINLKKLYINRNFKKYMNIKGDCTIVTCCLEIGPNSGYIDIGEKQFLLWDQYCHYNRHSSGLNNLKVDGEMQFKISQQKVDYSTCRKNYNFDNIEFELNIKEICYIGNFLELIDGL